MSVDSFVGQAFLPVSSFKSRQAGMPVLLPSCRTARPGAHQVL